MIKVSGSPRNSVSDLRALAESTTSFQEVNVITSNPLESALETGPLPAESLSDSRRSRREKVREKKRRDVQASRASREIRRFELEDGSVYQSSSREHSHTSLSHLGNDDSDLNNDSDLESPALGRFPPRGPSISPVIVVADVKPSTPPEMHSTLATTMTTSPLSTRPQTPVSADGFTPPHTPRGRSPSRRGPGDVPLDRVSLSRRREWRQAREAKARTMHAPSPVSPTRLAASSLNIPSFAEERMRDMERRMIRLERSGDMWLQAIVPVLDSLNRTLVIIQDERRLSGVNMTEVKEPAETTYPRLTRRSTLNEKALLDLKRMEKGEIAADGGRRGSGLDALEPLMRELQAASQPNLAAKPVEEAVA